MTSNSFKTALLSIGVFFLTGCAGPQTSIMETSAPPPTACPTTIFASEYVTATDGMTQVGADVTPRTFVGVVALSQSIAGNHVQGLYQPVHDVRSVNLCGDGQVYRYRDPMLGTTFTPKGYMGWSGEYGSYLGKLGDLLIAGGKYDRVIWVNGSYAGMSLKNFMPEGKLGFRLPRSFDTLSRLGIPAERVNAIIVNEGESDGIEGTSRADYRAMMARGYDIAKGLGFRGKWIVTRETWAYGCTSGEIRAAQTSFANGDDVIQGPDFDTLGSSYRYEEQTSAGCKKNRYVHFNAKGRDAAAAMMKDAIYKSF